jgi:hypothetical protein
MENFTNLKNIKKIGKAKKIVLNRVMSFEQCSQYEGEYLTEEFMRHLSKKNGTKYWLINFDCDGYIINDDGEEVLAFTYRKNVLDPEVASEALSNLRKTAMAKKINRGSFAGVLDKDKMPNYVGEFHNPGKFRTKYYSKVSGKLANQLISNISPSNIVGYFDKVDRNLKGAGSNIRSTAFIRDHPEAWHKALPYFQTLHNIYKYLWNGREPYEKQLEIAKQIPMAMIPETIFSTATINYSCQSALHLDKGNMEGGVAVLSVILDDRNPNTFVGSYLCLPEFGICIDNNHLDILIADNKYIWHGNTEFVPKNNKIYPMNMDKPNKMPTDQEIKNNWYFNRFVSVSYIRESILDNYVKNAGKYNENDTLGV